VAESTSTTTALIKELREGESISRSERLPVETLKGKKVKARLSSMRNSMNQMASRARESTERDYKIESGQFFTHDGSAVIVTVVCTCVEDEGEDDI
jgi:hypothetical protein